MVVIFKVNCVFSEEDDEASEIHLGRMLQILREFSTDPLLSAYVIDDVWDDMKAMRVMFMRISFTLWWFLVMKFIIPRDSMLYVESRQLLINYFPK